jgi:uncharacterized protein
VPKSHDDHIDAGVFSVWLSGMLAVFRGEGESDVPCGSCTSCCTSSQFIHIEPDEIDALSHIPKELQFPAPRLPDGHVVLGYNEHGHCPMLIDNACSIYEHRPRTCRRYDCRVFPASGVSVDDGKSAIAERANKWRFQFPTDHDRVAFDAAHTAAAYFRSHPDAVPFEARPTNAHRAAALVLRMHDVFIAEPNPEPEAVRVEIGRRLTSATRPDPGTVT